MEVLAAKKPSPDYRPLGIHPKAEKIWDRVTTENRVALEKKAKNVPGVKEAEARWGIALNLFRKACKKAGIPPFSAELLQNEAQRDDLVRKLKATAKKQELKLRTIYSALKGRGFLVSMSKEEFDEVKKYEGKYYITGKHKIEMHPDKKWTEIVAALVSVFGFTKHHGSAYLRIDTLSDIFMEDAGKKKISAFESITLIPEQAKLLTGLPENASVEEVIKELKKLVKKWYESGRIVDIKKT